MNDEWDQIFIRWEKKLSTVDSRFKFSTNPKMDAHLVVKSYSFDAFYLIKLHSFSDNPKT